MTSTTPYSQKLLRIFEVAVDKTGYNTYANINVNSENGSIYKLYQEIALQFTRSHESYFDPNALKRGIIKSVEEWQLSAANIERTEIGGERIRNIIEVVNTIIEPEESKFEVDVVEVRRSSVLGIIKRISVTRTHDITEKFDD